MPIPEDDELIAYMQYPDPLIMAIQKGQTAILEKLLAQKTMDPNQALHEGVTPLILAVQNKDIASIKLLLAHPAVDPNQAEKTGMTPLYLAAENGLSAIVKLLLEKGADPHLVAENGNSPLFMAAKHGHLRCAELLLAYGTDPDQAMPLVVAAQNGYFRIMELLLAKGANPNLDKKGYTALFAAVQNGHVKIAKFLLSKGSDPNQAHSLVVAAQNGLLNIVKLLLAQKDIEVDKPHSSGYTALYLAIQNGHASIVEQLLSQGANPNKKVKDVSPLSFALEKKNLEIVLQLLNHKAIDLNEVNDNMQALYSFAVNNNHDALLKKLFDLGFNPNNLSIPHSNLIKYMKHFGYQADDEGVCYGVAHIGIQAMLANDLERFDNRLKLMKRDQENNYQLLTQPERYQNEIIPFIEGIELYFQPADYPDLFEKRKAPLVQNAYQTSAIVNSRKIEAEGGLAQCANFSGVYNKQELIGLFRLLRESVEKSDPTYTESVPLALTNINHGISVGYDPIKKEWIFIDANKLEKRTILDDETMARSIMTAFGATREGMVAFSTQAYSTNKHKQAFDAIINQWTNNPAWKEMHEPSKMMAGFKGKNGGSWLFCAAREGHLKEVEHLLNRKDVNPNQENKQCPSPLLVAVQGGLLNIVEKLLNHEAINPNQPYGTSGQTPLIRAVEQRQPAIVEKLLAHKKIDPNQARQDGTTPLISAVHNNDLKSVKLLLAHPAIALNQAMNTGETPLSVAAQHGYFSIMKHLLAKRADPKLANQEGATPLFLASQNGHLSCAEFLLMYGADPNPGSPLVVAAQNGHARIVKLLLESKDIEVDKPHPSGYTALYLAAQNGHSNTIKQLLSKGADPNKKVKGLSPLSIALRDDHVEVIAQLLNHKDIDPTEVTDKLYILYNLAKKHNHTAILNRLFDFGLDPNKMFGKKSLLNMAIDAEKPAIVQILLEKGADPNTKDSWRGLPLHFASGYGYSEIIELLVEKGVDPNQENDDNEVALQCAIEGGHLTAVQALLRKGADPNKTNHNKIPLLSLAFSEGNLDILRELLNYKADPNTGNKNNITPLHRAASKGSLDFVETLLENGADPLTQNKKGETPLDLARKQGHLEVVAKLEDAINKKKLGKPNILDYQFQSQAKSTPANENSTDNLANDLDKKLKI